VAEIANDLELMQEIVEEELEIMREVIAEDIVPLVKFREQLEKKEFNRALEELQKLEGEV